MAYKIIVHVKAEDDLTRIDRAIALRIIRKLQWIKCQENSIQYGKRLTDPAIGDIRFRIGDYRAIAIIQEKRKTIIIVKIGHRKDVYR